LVAFRFLATDFSENHNSQHTGEIDLECERSAKGGQLPATAKGAFLGAPAIAFGAARLPPVPATTMKKKAAMNDLM
jgi:hypothetical protein